MLVLALQVARITNAAMAGCVELKSTCDLLSLLFQHFLTLFCD